MRGDPRFSRATDASTLKTRLRASQSGSLGTTQSVGCVGDFCSFDVTLSRVTNGPSISNLGPVLSEFRKKILSLEGGDVNEIGNRSSPRAGHGTIEVPFRCVVHARQDENLVKLVLKRHCDGEPFQKTALPPGLAEDAILGEFPGRCYGSVRVCFACFCVYDLIERARRPANDLKTKPQHPKRSWSNMYAVGNIPSLDSINTALSPEARAYVRAQQAISQLTTLDVAELRSYASPPPAVSLVMTAMFVLLTGGKILSWIETRHAMANGEAFLRTLLDFDCDSITTEVEGLVERYISGNIFRPDVISRVSVSASRASLWVLGMLEARKWRSGRGHDRLDRLTKEKAPAQLSNKASLASKVQIRGCRTDRMLARGGIKRSQTISALNSAAGGIRNLTQAIRSPLADRSSPLPPLVDWSSALANSSPSLSVRSSFETSQMSPLLFARTVDLLPVEMQSVSPHQNPFCILNHLPRRRQRQTLTKEERASRLITQRRQMERLASRPQDRLMKDNEASLSTAASDSRRVFVCSDGLTVLPYEVLGNPSLQLLSFSFVVVHDMFDTLDSTKIFFQKVVDRHPGCQVLVYNYSGQAGTVFSGHTSGISSMTHAKHLDELLQHINLSGEMLVSTCPFLLVGIGYGFNICTNLSAIAGHSDLFCQTLKGLVSINGFAQVDAQYAAILHAALGAFDKFPNDRPDLPISYLSRFLFSDAYLARVHPQLALNIYTAVANPITLHGRKALVRGALQSPACIGAISSLPLPIFALQSTENIFVLPSNVESLLHGRSVHHLWSHEIQPGTRQQHFQLGPHGRGIIQGILQGQRDEQTKVACVVWVRSGHEIRQEAASVVADIFGELAQPIEDGVNDINYRSVHQDINITQTSRLNSIVPRAAEEEKLSLGSQNASCGIEFADQIPYWKASNATENENVAMNPLSGEVGWPSPVDYGAIVDSVSDLRVAGVNDTEEEYNVNNSPCRSYEPPVDDTVDKSDVQNEHSKGGYINTFRMFIPGLALHDFTIRKRSLFCRNLAVCLADTTSVSITANRISVSGILAGSLFLNINVSRMQMEQIGDPPPAFPRIPSIWGAHVISRVPHNSSISNVEDPDGTASASCGAEESRAEDFFYQRDIPDELVSTDAQRCAGRYSDQVDTADQAIAERQSIDVGVELSISDEAIETLVEERQLKEMQRQVDVDATEAELVRHELIHGYEPPSGTEVPLFFPAPSEYKDREMPAAILSRHDPDKLFSEALQAETPSSVVLSSEGVDERIKAEFLSPQLLRESALSCLGTAVRDNAYFAAK